MISEAENGMRQRPLWKGLTDVLRMAQTQKLSCLPKQAPVTDGTCETLDRMVSVAGSSLPPGPNYGQGRKFFFLLENEITLTISMSIQTLPSQDGFLYKLMQRKICCNCLVVLSFQLSNQMFTRQLQFGKEYIVLVQGTAPRSDNLNSNPASSNFIIPL